MGIALAVGLTTLNYLTGVVKSDNIGETPNTLCSGQYRDKLSDCERLIIIVERSK